MKDITIMIPQRIGATVSGILKELTSLKKDTRQCVYDTIMEQLDAKERRHIQPYNYRNGVVTLHIDSPARLYDVSLKKKRLLKALQEKAGEEVKDIKLRIGLIR